MNGERNAPECKRDTYFRQLKLLTANLKSNERRIIDDNVLFALAGSLVDDNVFQIVCELKDIQDLKEYDMFEKYSQFVNESNLSREALLTRQELDIRRCYSVAETLSTAERNRLELETLNKETELKRRRLVGELLHELDNLIISQQTILEKAGIPLFRRTDTMNENNSNKPLATEDLDAHPEEADHQNEQLDERFHGESDEKTKEAMEFNSALELDDNVWNNLSNLFNEMQDRFCTIGALDDMGTRLDDLEKLINNLITQSIIEEQTEKSQAF
ncbi:hypothetical protein T11_16061 [Trichinella zimbabwensis]|uniref:Heat shock factor-binding protein 1 n=1 Tax=Trichinella zimbabwensis TaxID=268475 RepID=A0A0V1I6M5_9BILA|nr:hypothetical protein T11_16061 [Trichinella zimbabwensis]